MLGAESGTISFDFRSRSDGNLFTLRTSEGRSLDLRIVGSSLVYEARVPDRWNKLEAEDVRSLDDGRWHSAAVTVSPAGTRLYLDGYQVFCGTTTAFLKDLPGVIETVLGQGDSPEVVAFAVHPEVLTSREVMALSRRAEPLVEFAANRLSSYDVSRFSDSRHGAFWLRFRVRGRMQQGALLAAGGRGREQLAVTVGPAGITYAGVSLAGRRREVTASGAWSDGGWHEVVVTVGHGAVDLYVDGFREQHAPGEFFLGEVEGLDEIVVGQDCDGVRLSGEVQRAGIYDYSLSDAQIKRLCEVEPIETDALFDRGYQDSASYRIPSLLALASGTILAGADQRVSNANDSPNDINFVVRRSLDGGQRWEPARTVIDCPGSGEDASSVIDSCMVQDPNTGRIHVLIDHFPGGIGQPNCWASTGFDEQGRRLLRDLDDGRYVVEEDGAVTTIDGQATEFRVEDDGSVLRDGRPAGNFELAPGADPAESLLAIPTSYLQIVHSDDDGLTWSKPQDLNPQLKRPWMRFLGTCPGNGIALRHGAHAGRLVVPLYFNNDRNWLAMCATVAYSDDHGQTWQLSHGPNEGRETSDGPLDPQTFVDETWSLHEAAVVERQDGVLLLFIRNQHPHGHVAVSESHDAGQTWGAIRFDENLPEIWCQPNAIRLPSAEGEDRIVFANASLMLPFRGCGVIRLSLDGGAHMETLADLQPRSLRLPVHVRPTRRKNWAALGERVPGALFLTPSPELVRRRHRSHRAAYHCGSGWALMKPTPRSVSHRSTYPRFNDRSKENRYDAVNPCSASPIARLQPSQLHDPRRRRYLRGARRMRRSELLRG